jgi:hypothetical protein
VRAVAEEDGARTTPDDGGRQRRDTGPMLDGEGRGREVAEAEAVRPLNTVAEPGHRAAVSTCRLAAAAILSPFLRPAAATIRAAALWPGLLPGPGLSRWFLWRN